MSPLAHAQRRSRTTIAAFFFLLLAGAYAYLAIPKESDPDITIPIIYVPLIHEGISPEDAEKLLIRPLETEFRSLEGLKELRSDSHDGGGSVVAEFHAGSDIDKALQEVRDKLDIVKGELPADTEDPIAYEVNLSRFPVLNISLYGDVSYRLLDNIARDLKDEIQALPNVLEVELVGDREEVIEVIISPIALESYNLQVQDLWTALRNANLLIAAGGLKQAAGEYAVEVAGRLETEADLLNLPLITQNEQGRQRQVGGQVGGEIGGEGEGVVRVKDVANVRRTFKDDDSVSRTNGIVSLSLLVKKRTGTNIIETIDQVRQVVQQAQQLMPPAVQVVIGQDQSRDIRNTLRDLVNNINSAVLLVMVVILGTLGFRSGLLVGLAIPGSFLTAVLLLYVLGFTVNVVVLFALILSVGMLVDGAIVITEYATRRHREGLPVKYAFREAGERMAWPIIASTLTTLAAFLPLVFWPGIVGEFMKYLPITVLFVLSASLLMALIFLPVLGTNLSVVGEVVCTAAMVFITFSVSKFLLGWLGGGGGLSTLMALGLGAIALYYIRKRRHKIFAYLLSAREDDTAMPAGNLDSPLSTDTANSLKPLPHSGFAGAYVRFLSKAINHCGKIIIGAFVLLVGAYMAYGKLGKGVEFFPDIEPSAFIVGVQARGNLSLSEKSRLMSQVEEHVLALQKERGEFQMIATQVGYSDKSEARLDSIGSITLELADWRQRRKAAVIIEDVKARTAGIYGIGLEFVEARDGPAPETPVDVRISGEDWQEIMGATQQVRQFMEADGRFVDIEDSLPIPEIIWNLDLDRGQAAKFGVDVQTLGNFVQLVTQGIKVTDIQPDDSHDKVDIIVRFPEEYRTLEQLNSLRINTENGAVPADVFLKPQAKPKSGILSRVDGKRTHSVKSDVAEGVLTSDATQAISDWLAEVSDPFSPQFVPQFANVEVSLQGENQRSQEAEAFLKKAFTVALFIMAVILLTQFNNFYNVFLILAAVVMSTVGVLLGLMITGQPFGIVMCGIGVIALAGIVVNNNIVLVDTYDSYMRQGLDVRHAVLRTAAERFRPVLLTAVTTVLGLLPMTLKMNIDFLTPVIEIGAPSTQWWTQLATSIVFGLTFATLLTLIVTPSALVLRQRLGLLPNQARRQK